MQSRVQAEGALWDTNLLVKCFAFLPPRELVAIASVSWRFFIAQNSESIWRYWCLLDYVDQRSKVAHFCFKGSWKATYIAPCRLPTSLSLQNVKVVQLGTPIHWLMIPFSTSINCILDSGEVLRPPPHAVPPPKEKYRLYNIRGADLRLLPCRTGGIERRHAISRDDFVKQFEMQNRPVVISGLMDGWPAMQRWQEDALATERPNLLLRVSGRSSHGRRFRMKVFDFLTYCKECNGEKPFFVFDRKVFFENPELKKDYTVPPHFHEDLLELMDEDDRPDYRWWLIGPNGSGSPFHTDPHETSAWNGVVAGCKRISFYPPDKIPPGVDKELIHTDYYASPDPMEWYYRVYPKLTCAQQPLETYVNPGEIVFIPSGWWHQVLNIGTTIAITQNFCSKVTFSRVAENMNKTGSKALRRAFKCALVDSPKHCHLAVQIDSKRHLRRK